MTEHARQQPLCFDPVIDTDEWRRAQMDRLMASAREYEAEHGPFDPEKVAAARTKYSAQFAELDAKFAEAERDA